MAATAIPSVVQNKARLTSSWHASLFVDATEVETESRQLTERDATQRPTSAILRSLQVIVYYCVDAEVDKLFRNGFDFI